MVDKTIMTELSEAMEKYESLAYALGKSDNSKLQKNTETEMILSDGISLQQLRNVFLTLGEILDVDPKNNVITAVVPTGSMNASRAFAVARLEDGYVNIAVFFKEGLIKQHGAKKVIDLVRKQINR